MALQPAFVPANPIPQLHTPGHIECPACELYRQRAFETAGLGSLTFCDAAPLWLRQHAPAVQEKTGRDYQYYIRTLNNFFRRLPLNRIHLGHVQAYREERLAHAGASTINHEINTLKQIMECAGLWNELARFYRPLKMPKAQVGQALEPEAEERLFQVASSSKRWRVAYWCSLITATTTAGPKEITHLHLCDLDLEKRSMRIRDGLKNVHRDHNRKVIIYLDNEESCPYFGDQADDDNRATGPEMQTLLARMAPAGKSKAGGLPELQDSRLGSGHARWSSGETQSAGVIGKSLFQ